MITNFLSWHYGRANKAVRRIAFTAVVFLYHYFSIGFLLQTLFAPWKRQAYRFDDLFPLNQFFEALTFNLVSRTIGASIRIGTIVIGFLAVGSALVFALAIVLLWPLLPLVSWPIYLWITKETVLSHIKKTDHTVKEAARHLFRSLHGRFILSRLGIFEAEFFQKIDEMYDALLPESFQAVPNLPQAFFLLVSQSKPIRAFFENYHAEANDILALATWHERAYHQTNVLSTLWSADALLRTPGIGHDWAYGYTANLDRYSYPVVTTGNPLGLLYGRAKELLEMEEVCTKFSQHSLLLIGEPGSGRHALVEAFAAAIQKGQTIPYLRHKRIIGLSLDTLISDAKAEKDVAAVILAIFEEARHAGNIILVIDQIDRFVGKSAEHDLSELITKQLESGQLQILAITTAEKFHEIIEEQSDFLKNFTLLRLEEAGKEEILQVLETIVPAFEKRYGVFFTYQALKEIVTAGEKLFPNIPFPQKAIDALDRIANHVQSLPGSQTITVDHVDSVLSTASHIPYGKIKISEKERLMHLEKLLHKRIIGQNEAINAIAAALRRSRLELTMSQKPIGSFLFLGPTGVGKTETAKALAAIYFGTESAMVRFDMSQYQTNQALRELIGDARTHEPGLLTSAINKNPFSVLLLDEFEKAETGIQNVFLPALDEGYITSASGKKIHLENTIIIATSNAGSTFIHEKMQEGISADLLTRPLLETIMHDRVFSPELINRFDGVIVFTPLSQQELKAIASLQLQRLNNTLNKAHGITIELSPDLIDAVVQKGFDPTFGARPMRRAIQEMVEDVIAKKLLNGEIKRGAHLSSRLFL